jgi:ribosomal protein S18 acetylase RimI-like enzyme
VVEKSLAGGTSVKELASEIEVKAVADVDDDLVDALARLLPQLSASASPPTAEDLREIVGSPSSTVLVARDPDAHQRIVGTLTLVVFRIPSGVRAWIEDVVVDGSARRRGVGEALTREAIRRASALGARTIELTSRPAKEAANRLYQRLGFTRRDTNVYRYASPRI